LSRPHLELVEEEVRAPSGVVRRWLTVQRKPAVVIAPLTHSGSFVLVREERIPVRATLWSFPAGQIDESGEILETARRELREETGYEVAPTGEMKSLGSFFTSPGLTNECVHFCLARPVERQADIEDEMILEVREFGPADLRQMIATNEIRDSNTLSMCARLAAAGILDLTMSI
jgi:ADP-ribose pyrophosphatase